MSTSKYADKKPRPGCRMTGCDRTADTLAIRHGVLGWWCEEHKNK